DDEDVLAVRGADAAERADVTLESRSGEPGDLGRGNRGCGIADELCGLAPAAAEGEGDVVVLDAGEPGDVCGGTGCDLERVCVRNVERVLVSVGHGSTLRKATATR